MKKVFGYDEFRDGQEQVLTHLANSDVMGVMPTGSGKSLCYVLPALAMGRTVVVSPLIALMRDQVQSLESAGVRAAFINSSLDRNAQNTNYLSFVRGEANLLYVAPERFGNSRFVKGLRGAGVNLLAIDEAHCVSEWGHDFRPDYLTLGAVREAIGSPRTLALTATAEPLVQADILARLGIPGAQRVVTSVDRPNLRFSVEQIRNVSERRGRLVQFVAGHRGQPGIVYARTRALVEELAATLTESGLPAEAYHAGMETPHRDSVQQRFTLDEISLIVGTNAFGLGVDKPDVRFVVHFNMPGRLEAYYQQAGRAGRDGEPAECVLLYGRADIAAQRTFIDRAHPDEGQVRKFWQEILHDWPDMPMGGGFQRNVDGYASAIAALRNSGLLDQASLRPLSNDPNARIDLSTVAEHRSFAEDRLSQMVEYTETTGCRRSMILRYFGESPGGECPACDNCTVGPTEAHAYYPASLYEKLMALREQVARRTMRAPHQILELRTVRELATYRPRTRDELIQTWGIGEIKADWFGQRIVRVIAAWEKSNPDAPARTERAPRWPEVLFRPQATAPAATVSEPIFERLRQWRNERARKDGVPAFVIFSDRTLREIASTLPRDDDSLMRIRGVGPSKLNAMGPEILEIIRDMA